MRKRFVNPSQLPPPRGYTHTVRVEDAKTFVFIAGQTAVNARGEVVGGDDLAVQTRQTFRNLETALAAAGASFGDVVQLTIYLTDPSRIEVVREVRREFLSRENPPAVSTVGVTRLVRPGVQIEVEAVAALA